MVFVVGLWLSVSVTTGLLVTRYGRNHPYADDWAMVPGLTEAKPLSLSWLWAQHNEHRIPLPKLVYHVVTKLSNYDFRAGMLFNFVALALSLGCILTARKVRGECVYTDAFFPLALLQWGNQALSWSFHIAFTCAMVLTCIFLLVLVLRGRRLTAGRRSPGWIVLADAAALWRQRAGDDAFPCALALLSPAWPGGGGRRAASSQASSVLRRASPAY